MFNDLDKSLMQIEPTHTGFLVQLDSFGKSPTARMNGLIRAFREWCRHGKPSQQHVISAHNVESLKAMIHQEVLRARVKHPGVVTDQILFLLIGAIQLSQKQQSEQAWDIVSDAIHGFLRPATNYKALFGFSIMGLILLGSMLLFYTKPYPQQTHYSPPEFANMNDNDTPNLITPTIVTLQDVYRQMKKGICQLPQAGMLAEDQRAAYLAFIQDGLVDIHTAESLAKAMRHVSCAYPQQLMMTPH